MLIAFFAALLLFRLWLFWSAAVYIKTSLCTQPLYAQVRISLGVLSLGSVTLRSGAKKPLVFEVCGIPLPLPRGKKRAAQPKEKPGRKKKNNKAAALLRAMLPAALHSARNLLRRLRIAQLEGGVQIGFADDAGATALACAGAKAAVGALARFMDRAEQLHGFAVSPCFGADRLWVGFTCIVSLKVRHIIIETFMLAKEAFKWARILSKTSWIQQ